MTQQYLSDEIPLARLARQHDISRNLIRVTNAHLTGNSRLFRNAHHPDRWVGAACGGLDPDPATRVRGAFPHLLCSKLLQVGTAKSSEPPFRAIVAHSHQHSDSMLPPVATADSHEGQWAVGA